MPSPSTSPTVTPYGVTSVVKSTFAAKEAAVTVPDVLVFRYTDTVVPAPVP